MAGEVDGPVVLGGFPQSGLDTYVGKLVRAGHSVAIALQDEQKERHIREGALVLRRPGVERPRPLATLSSMLPDSSPTNEVLP